MKKFKNRKNVKNVNNTVKNNANMDGFEELVNAAKEFKEALDDEVTNREYERKKLAKKLVENPVLTIDDVVNAKIDETNGAQKSHEEAFWHKAKDIINPVTEEKREKSEFLHKPFWLGREDFLTYKVEKSKKNKPASEVESLKAELENLNAHFKGVCAERDRFERCLKSAENALVYKDKVIERIKKKNAKRMSEKCDVIAVLNKEIEFQYKRREKAEKFVNTLGQAFDLLKKNVEDYEHSIGR